MTGEKPVARIVPVDIARVSPARHHNGHACVGKQCVTGDVPTLRCLRQEKRDIVRVGGDGQGQNFASAVQSLLVTGRQRVFAAFRSVSTAILPRTRTQHRGTRTRMGRRLDSDDRFECEYRDAEYEYRVAPEYEYRLAPEYEYRLAPEHAYVRFIHTDARGHLGSDKPRPTRLIVGSGILLYGGYHPNLDLGVDVLM